MGTLSRRAVLAGAMGVAATVTLPVPIASAAVPKLRLRLPAPRGRYPVGSTDLHLVDRSRPDPYVTTQPYRELMVNLTYPARSSDGARASWLTPGWATQADETFAFVTAPQAANLVDWAGTRSYARRDVAARPGRWPVLVYQLGHWGSHSTNRAEIEDLASRGYVVASFEPTYETPVVFPGGRLVPANAAAFPPNQDQYSDEFLAYLRHIYAARTADSVFMLDELARRRLPGGLRVDLGRVGAFSGISGAGLMTLTLMEADRRVRAGIVGDTAVGFKTRDGGAIPLHQVSLTRPVLAIRPTSEFATPNPMWDEQWRALRGWRRELELVGAGIGWCSDLQTVMPQVRRGLDLPADAHVSYLGTIDPDAAVTATRAYQAAFFDHHLRGRPATPSSPMVRRRRGL
ncbi:hypothetical protein KOI35_35995 [Actinoplanes bogorensis]|uniref:Uncharacterized protein n=1 Tax=Paractinoplanes bogorensis TaxID=1610840 RepID=A0ABS5YZS8_9ACTN|nr:hypothetical protein [Actinoplanes bogorensis]MBU2668927.1 hypothetical protein [Actinoplanes bogorensis]